MLRASAAGLSLIDVLFAMSLAMAAAGAAVPAMLELNRAVKLRAAAAFISGYLQQARLEAVTRGRPVGVRFRADAPEGNDWRLAVFVDGNGNGIRNADIDAGVDGAVDRETAFSARCPSVRIARLMSRLLDCERSLKASGTAGGVLFRKLMTDIAHQAARAR